MLKFLSAQPNLVVQAEEIVRTLQSAGFIAYFAGGCVRDALRCASVHDIDIATSATPEEVSALFPAQSIGVGKSFGVMLVVVNGISYDVATFRTDGGYQDGRHPDSIIYDTAEHDALRRDFTVNALFYDPIKQQVIDYVGGVADLNAGMIRTVGNARKRFQEDRLRMLRAIRFATVCDWKIDRVTWNALKGEASHLSCVSIERIRSEFIRILCEAKEPERALELLSESGLLAQFFPELLRLRGCLQDPTWHPEGDVWQHTVRMLTLLPPKRDPNLVWAVLLHDIGKPNALHVGRKPDGSPWYRTPGHAAIGAQLAEGILRRFKESWECIDCVCTAVRYHMQFVELPKMRTASIRKMLGRDTIRLELALHRLDCLSSHANLDLYDFAQARLKEFESAAILPKPFITGKVLLAMGYTPSPALGKRIKRAYTEQLDGVDKETLFAQSLITAPTHSNRSKRISFVVGGDGRIPLLRAWDARFEQNWLVSLLVLPGYYWDKPLPQKAQLVRLVTNCAGKIDFPESNTFDLLIAYSEFAEADLLATAKHTLIL